MRGQLRSLASFLPFKTCGLRFLLRSCLLAKHCQLPVACAVRYNASSNRPSVEDEFATRADPRTAGTDTSECSNGYSSGGSTLANAMGWCYEEVDPETGRTPLDILYEERLQRIKAVFEHPLPPLPRDGTASPDLLVGFAHYDYRLRDQYRAVIARALDVSVSEVRLSVAWSGRFNVSQFNRVQKVCGVCVRPSVSAVPSKSSSSSFSRMTAEGGHQAQEHFDREHDLSKNIKCLVGAINERKSEMLIGCRWYRLRKPCKRWSLQRQGVKALLRSVYMRGCRCTY
ncbi:hypothetical protein TRVL_06631 [Trypanosoma vivax]|nr:hypothetical protein TRVL_06631 [Trypanosoma vivax]